MSDARIVRSIWSSDRKHWFDVYRRPDGHYGFVGISQTTEDGDTFWSGTDYSGIYETADEAERDALEAVPWLKGRLSQ